MRAQALTKSDWAKYPFTPEAAEYVKRLGIQIEDLTSPEYGPVLDRAEERIQEALLFRTISQRSSNDEIEIPSFPIAIMMVAAIDDKLVKRRYALAEAKRVSSFLQEEDREKIMTIARDFGWHIELATETASGQTYDFKLHFADYLKNSAVFHEKEWKLVNKLVSEGAVYLTKREAGRLLEEEARRYVESKLDTTVGRLPDPVMKSVNRLEQLLVVKKEKIHLEEIPKTVAIPSFPPCIKALYDTIASGSQLSHMGRFALTSFLVSIGMTVENVMDLFRQLSDFDERLTRYQVEHIAGVRGSRTKYIPPRCDTLRTHGLCTSTEELCEKVRHPLAFYRRKLNASSSKSRIKRT